MKCSALTEFLGPSPSFFVAHVGRVGFRSNPCHKPPQNLRLKLIVFSHGFCGSGVWERLYLAILLQAV